MKTMPMQSTAKLITPDCTDPEPAAMLQRLQSAADPQAKFGQAFHLFTPARKHPNCGKANRDST